MENIPLNILFIDVNIDRGQSMAVDSMDQRVVFVGTVDEARVELSRRDLVWDVVMLGRYLVVPSGLSVVDFIAMDKFLFKNTLFVIHDPYAGEAGDLKKILLGAGLRIFKRKWGAGLWKRVEKIVRKGSNAV